MKTYTPTHNPEAHGDEYWMARALRLAEQGLYSTSPNPRVGCVIVKDNVLVGEGWHQQAGGPHAEVHALRMAGDQAQAATAYVTLEPCSHFGRTPPCAHALANAGVARVVGACRDPNPQVAGRGFQYLRDAGIEVTETCLQNQAESLNAGFIQRMRSGLPWVRIKLAQSLDGRTAMASGESQWITGPAARRDVQRLRARSCAVITGASSVLIDNPSMTVRPAETGIKQPEHLWRQPLRVVIDGQQRLSGNEAVFDQPGDILLAVTNTSLVTVQRAASLGQLTLWQSPATQTGKVDLPALLRFLAEQGHNDILVESGARLAAAFVETGLVNELVLYCAPTLLGSNARPLLALPLDSMQQQIRWHWQDIRMVGQDLRLTLQPEAARP
ncbi:MULTISPECIES: bifunctional diaminohydroxyphosphoribosylaminopyrimidine deaminase/5-amino-6-(5-phosphoribosylamino)uracil reductase RibD [unclassified Oceanobacter]|uniref:bifunctional diaminohydroxyphosphoribosylaminopyrimidine deaminase/5-amino-6-(5-phosphoribosylamino)uracil reductase RibD n=1 Tax=unclassified Oceanobacter TaxID=2620260 RepID=UPI00273628D9|nr:MULTISPECIES: bifunctional diaminohydroxyphosphoribosylaminopyrimidine deaminase/5-amino-6-(5-phosphoribosylamino)uracil reductase RibD [unclassified Oceanobacter]MDP2609853.1 bifunctional diaminohydroxyphosphoribosylaminopyrimidine deaminase/5-amino-6-(5-phosphoribosylamino)uracil reductase RibD [Oceanobacter sp. 1_MG-2023]MDP2612269.1 bifunctional diaminohydroxyphosphoribosylaminopyrimidine deaminase/5-amino-6-(5-phosphoribosylamino)uracil reductase RibD [Oceanobacter sp. 2_MG-2023]